MARICRLRLDVDKKGATNPRDSRQLENKIEPTANVQKLQGQINEGNDLLKEMK